MGWRYRRVKETYPNGEEGFSVRSVYCNRDGSIYAISEVSNDPYGTTEEELEADFALMKKAFQSSVIDLNTFKFAEQKDE